MIGSLGSSGGSANDLDVVLRVLALVTDPEQAKAATEELQGLLKELADKQAALVLATSEAVKHRQAGESAMRAADEAVLANTRRVSELNERARTVEAAFARLATAQTEFNQARDVFESKSTAQQADLTLRSDNLARREITLRQSEQDVAALKADLQMRLDRIRAAAA